MSGKNAMDQIGGALHLVGRALGEDGFFTNLMKGDDDEILIGPSADARPPCATCKSERVLGEPGHQVPCPLCSPPASPPVTRPHGTR
jgi:hypothetical protein